MDFVHIVMSIFIAVAVLTVSVTMLILTSALVISFGNTLGWWAVGSF